MYRESEFIAKAEEETGAPIVAHAEARLQRPGELLPRSGLLAATRDALVFVVEDILEPGEVIVLPTEAIDGVQVTDDFLGKKLIVESSEGRLELSNVKTEQATSVLTACGLVSEKPAGTPPQAAPEPISDVGALPSVRPPRDSMRLPDLGEPPPRRKEPPRPPEQPVSQPPAPPDSSPYWDPRPPSSDYLELVEPITDLEPIRTEATLGKPEYYGLLEETDAEVVDTAEDEPLVVPTRTSVRIAPLISLAIGLAILAGVGVFYVQKSDFDPAGQGTPEAPAVEGIWNESQRLRTALPVASPDAQLVVFYRSFPGNEGDWITVVPAGTPDDQYSQWYFLRGQEQGTLILPALPEGRYEVRGYYDWPDGGYTVQDRYAFTVRR